jgi:hypothetical protein
MIVIRIDSMQSLAGAKSHIGLPLNAITAIESKEIGCTDGKMRKTSGSPECWDALIEPCSLWSPKYDNNVPSPPGSAEPDSPGRTSKRPSTNRENGYFDMPLFTQETSVAPHQLSEQESLSDTGEYAVTNMRVKEIEYGKEFVTECLLPFAPIQDGRLRLFFTHIHPMFPIVDEYSFMEIYEKHRTSKELIAPEHYLLLLAISFVAFAVCSTNVADNIARPR